MVPVNLTELEKICREELSVLKSKHPFI
ncbi:unnamed protein product [Tetraodon nigroviridis]|uniref:(spotted green pufferfish) hypothetical protein n=1 Tax=Tetraodon nigroviridis TaxID=99883 RepID=Q4S6P3_TETNG|nr:unnamed protein product [Tetraodon nigroviridis]